MIGYRLLIRFKTARGELPAWKLLALGVAVAGLDRSRPRRSASAIVFNVSPLRVLGTALDFDDLELDPSRPGSVLGAGLIVVAVDLVRAKFGPRRGRCELLATIQA